MNRRSFFKSLALLGAAASAPAIFIPKLEPVRWKIIRPQTLWIPNPAYALAPFEIRYIDMPMVCTWDDPYPPRFGADYQPIPPFIQA